MTRWSEADLAQVNAQIRGQLAQPLLHTPGKYGNTRCTWQGMKFDSQHERDKFREFELERIAGKIRAVVRQVSMPMYGSSRRIRLDFMIVENDGRIRWVDAKGYPTKEWLLKRDQVQQVYGITIETI